LRMVFSAEPGWDMVMMDNNKRREKAGVSKALGGPGCSKGGWEREERSDVQCSMSNGRAEIESTWGSQRSDK
jgi:hypothetical protein